MTKKQEFLKTVGVTCERGAIQNSIVAAFQHNKVYNGNPGLADREELRRVLRSEIRDLASGYSATIAEAKHCKNISSLADSITRQFARILLGGRFKIGTAQKAFNLYLKFLWCLGSHPTPPHCPLDRSILKKVSVYKAWTKMDCIDTYKTWMEKIGEKASSQSIAEWELEKWKR